MTKEEFYFKLDEKRENGTEVESLYKEFAFSNSNVKIGDFIKDHIGLIKVDKISFVSHTSVLDYPSCIYSGDIFPIINSSRKIKRFVYQQNVIFSIRVI